MLAVSDADKTAFQVYPNPVVSGENIYVNAKVKVWSFTI
jgi:hypothetical protein